ncbi:FGGY-family carbohydrate kinase [Cryptosporangium minutisporangium]|uniref:Carbohydrate kinase FGGY C-terminal domain-containing protein n=1 Tax=Cryptosporangium minutisporangium TaxID=113569 RepID=A0ABP6T4R2_9ACTN
MTVVVGLHLGSDSARALALGPDGAIAAHAYAPYPGAVGWPAGYADPAGWLSGVTAALEAILADLPAERPCAAISLGGQSPTTVPANGGLAVTYRHPAGATGTPAEQHEAQLSVLREESGGDVDPLQVYDWLSVRLGADAVQSRWPGDPELPGYGPVVATGSLIGHTDGSHGLPAGIPLVAGAQDAYLAFWAGAMDRPGRGMDPGGRTGGLAVVVADGLRLPGMYALTSAVSGLDILGGPVSGHGLMLEWLRTITGCGIPELIELASTVPPGADGVLVLPYLEGARAPRWNRQLRAEIVGLGSDAGRPQLARAVLEATAYGLAHVAEGLAAGGVALTTLVAAGSPARSPLWNLIKASVLEVPVEVPDETDLAAYGAALSAGAGAGWWPGPGVSATHDWPRPAVTIVDPEPQPAYREGYQRFLELGASSESRK